MTIFSHVNTGDPFRPSASRENALTDLLNAYGMDGAGNGKRTVQRSFFISVYNASDETIKVGRAATLDESKDEKNGLVPCVPFDGTSRPWGIARTDIEKGAAGTLIIGGITTAKVTGGSGDRITPDSDGKLAKAPAGEWRVLFTREDGLADIQHCGPYPYAGDFRMRLEKGKPSGGGTVDPENDDDMSDSSSSGGLHGCGVVTYCNGHWGVEPIGDCDEDSDSSSSSSSSSSSGGEPTLVVAVDGGTVFYGAHVLTVSGAKFQATDGYIYVNWNAEQAKLAFSSQKPTPTEKWHCAIIGEVRESGNAICIIQQQHGPVVQALSREGIFTMVKENLIR